MAKRTLSNPIGEVYFLLVGMGDSVKDHVEHILKVDCVSFTNLPAPIVFRKKDKVLEKSHYFKILKAYAWFLLWSRRVEGCVEV